MAAKTRLAARQTQMLPPACGLVSLFFFCVSRGAGLAGVVAKGATAAAAVAVVAAGGATSTPAWFAVLAAAVAEISAQFRSAGLGVGKEGVGDVRTRGLPDY